MNGHFHLFAVTFSVNFIYETYWLLFLAYTFLCLWPYCFSYLNFFPPPQLPKYFLPGNMKCYLPNSSSASKNIFCSLQLLWLIITTRYYITIIICMCARVHTHTHTHTHTHIYIHTPLTVYFLWPETGKFISICLEPTIRTLPNKCFLNDYMDKWI